MQAQLPLVLHLHLCLRQNLTMPTVASEQVAAVALHTIPVALRRCYAHFVHNAPQLHPLSPAPRCCLHPAPVAPHPALPPSCSPSPSPFQDLTCSASLLNSHSHAWHPLNLRNFHPQRQPKHKLKGAPTVAQPPQDYSRAASLDPGLPAAAQTDSLVLLLRQLAGLVAGRGGVAPRQWATVTALLAGDAERVGLRSTVGWSLRRGWGGGYMTWWWMSQKSSSVDRV